MPKKSTKAKAPKTAKSAKPRSKPAPKADTAPTDKPRRLSGLDAAAEVLCAAGEPMKVAAITERAREQGLWSPAGKTPAATLNSALVRDIAAKSGASRFRKHSRGLFELNAP